MEMNGLLILAIKKKMLEVLNNFLKYISYFKKFIFIDISKVLKMNTIKNTEIVKYCIYYKIQPKTDTYLARIATSKNGKCPSTFNNYFLGAVFYGWKNDIRPFPAGTLLFKATFATTSPYNTILIRASFDPFYKEPNTVNFVTYSQPAPGIIPLYIYHKNKSFFPTFKIVPGWKQDILSPIFLMWEFYTDFGSNFTKRNKVTNPALSKLGNYSKFSCINLICVPDEKSDKSFLFLQRENSDL